MSLSRWILALIVIIKNTNFSCASVCKSGSMNSRTYAYTFLGIETSGIYNIIFITEIHFKSHFQNW